MDREQFANIVAGLAANYADPDIHISKSERCFPNRDAVIDILGDLRLLLFPGYFGNEAPNPDAPGYYIGSLLSRIQEHLLVQVEAALAFRDATEKTPAQIRGEAEQIVDGFLESLPHVQELLITDVQAFFDGDPAAQSKAEVVFTYPGLYTIFVYRVAHELYVRHVPLIPRIMTEHAHSLTGVDINAGARIDAYFFMDHATGIVIGETTVIGKHVKLYQGVTLGALSLRAGQGLKGVKRHPTIEDDVTIYSNASVLGGQTVIGHGSVIGGSAFVTSSIAPNSRVSVKNQEISIRTPEDRKPDKPEM